MKNQIITSSRKVGVRDINAVLQSAPISRIGCCPQGRDAEGRRGFTLIEVLVVVLIIGVLAAVAVPQYQKAVLKSRYSAMMPIAKALAEGNEIYYMEHGNYSEEPTELVVQGKAEYPDGTEVLIYSEDGLSYVRATNDSVPNARYLVYQKHSGNFADTTMCEAGDDRAKELCQALGGEEISGGNSSGENGWTAYVLTGSYGSTDTFAEDSGEDTESQDTTACQPGDTAPSNMPIIDTSKIEGSTNTAVGTPTCVNGKWKYQWTDVAVYEQYEVCNSGDTEYGCAGSTFSGKKSSCLGTATNGCAESTFSGMKSFCYGAAANGCAGSTFSGEMSYCDGEDVNGCAGTIILGGAYCESKKEGGCDGAIYQENSKGVAGCCRGNYCPTGSPKCGEWNNETQAYDIDGTW